RSMLEKSLLAERDTLEGGGQRLGDPPLRKVVRPVLQIVSVAPRGHVGRFTPLDLVAYSENGPAIEPPVRLDHRREGNAGMRLDGRVSWREDVKRQPVWLQKSRQLADRLGVVLHMLQHLVAQEQ